jgi:hypothetical protein
MNVERRADRAGTDLSHRKRLVSTDQSPARGNWADAWMGEWGVTALVVGGVVAGGWLVLKMFGR